MNRMRHHLGPLPHSYQLAMAGRRHSICKMDMSFSATATKLRSAESAQATNGGHASQPIASARAFVLYTQESVAYSPSSRVSMLRTDTHPLRMGTYCAPSPPSPSDVHSVRLSRSSCMISVESCPEPTVHHASKFRCKLPL